MARCRKLGRDAVVTALLLVTLCSGTQLLKIPEMLSFPTQAEADRGRLSRQVDGCRRRITLENEISFERQSGGLAAEAAEPIQGVLGLRKLAIYVINSFPGCTLWS